MKNLKDIIIERLHINKDTKSDYNLINSSLDDFTYLIKEKLDYDLTLKDLYNFRNGFLPNGKVVSDAKFTDITDDNEEFNYYEKVIGHNNNIEKLRLYYIIQELNTGCIFEYINTKIQASTYEDYKKYRIGYVLDNIENRENRDMVKIFKIDF